MKTSAISSTANLTSGTATTNKSAGASSDMQFSQLLSREMAAQPKTGDQSRANAAQDGKQAPAARSDSTSGEAKSPKQPDAQTPAESATSAASAAKPAPAETAKGASDTDQDEETTVSAASAELLAMVASLTQPASKPAAPAAEGDTDRAALDASEDGAPSGRKAQDFSAVAVSATPDTDALLAAQAAPSAQTPPLATPTTLESDSQPVTAALTSQLRGEALLVQATAKDIAHAARHGTAASTAAQRLNTRPDAAPGKGSEPDSREFDAELAQAKDEKRVPGTGTASGKSVSDQAQLSTSPAAERATPRTAPEHAQPVVAFNLNTVSAAHAQPTPPAAAAQAADMLTPRVGSRGWDQALGQKVVWMVGSEQQSASLTLNPPDLGPLQVVLHVSDNQATASFTAAQPEVRHALEAAMPKLREMLGDAGIQLSQANVSAGTPGNQQSAFEQPQQSARHQAERSESNDTPAPTVRAGKSQTIAGGLGMVDTFA